MILCLYAESVWYTLIDINVKCNSWHTRKKNWYSWHIWKYIMATQIGIKNYWFYFILYEMVAKNIKQTKTENILFHSSIPFLFFVYISNTVSINGNNWYQFVKHQFHSTHLLYRISDHLQFQCVRYLVIVMWCNLLYHSTLTRMHKIRWVLVWCYTPHSSTLYS